MKLPEGPVFSTGFDSRHYVKKNRSVQEKARKRFANALSKNYTRDY
jgi:hypothetical protein